MATIKQDADSTDRYWTCIHVEQTTCQVIFEVEMKAFAGEAASGHSGRSGSGGTPRATDSTAGPAGLGIQSIGSAGSPIGG